MAEAQHVVSYHQVSIADVMFNQPSPQDDHASIHCPHRLVVHFANIWKNTHIIIPKSLVIVNLSCQQTFWGMHALTTEEVRS